MEPHINQISQEIIESFKLLEICLEKELIAAIHFHIEDLLDIISKKQKLIHNITQLQETRKMYLIIENEEIKKFKSKIITLLNRNQKFLNQSLHHLELLLENLKFCMGIPQTNYSNKGEKMECFQPGSVLTTSY